jgi:hypothetical protein
MEMRAHVRPFSARSNRAHLTQAARERQSAHKPARPMMVRRDIAQYSVPHEAYLAEQLTIDPFHHWINGPMKE